MKALDHNQIQRQFSFKHYRKAPKDTTVAHCWFSRQHMFDTIAARKSDTLAVYRSVEFDSYMLVSRAVALTMKVGPPWEIDLDEPPALWSSACGPLDYQGLGTFFVTIPLELMVEERLACVDDMQVNSYFAEQQFKNLPVEVINELERHQLC